MKKEWGLSGERPLELVTGKQATLLVPQEYELASLQSHGLLNREQLSTR